MPSWSSLTFQDRASPIIEQLVFFHDHTIVVLSLITVFILYAIISTVTAKSYCKYLMDGQEVETIWAVLPAVVLIFVAVPSMKILYIIEDSKLSNLTAKVTGHQWYWSYEMVTTNGRELESFIEPSKTTRLLSRRADLIFPVSSYLRLLITSADVIHAWALPTMGVKVDAVPGRLNQTFIFRKRQGKFSGQCSEICGANHSFIPISVTVSSPDRFLK
jgi:cytochrome c oxidase subunit 2